MNRKYMAALLASLALLSVMPGCKPSEKNYKAAYETAKEKRDREAYDADLGIDYTNIRKDGDPVWRKMSETSDSVMWRRQWMKPMTDTDTVHKYNVTVAQFKMPTNVRAMTESLKGMGYNAYALQTNEPVYLVEAGGFPSFEEAAAFLLEFMKKRKDFSYIGLPGGAVIDESPR